MKTYSFRVGDGKHLVEAEVVAVGRDLTVTIGGGDSFHVGAVAVASPRPSLKGDGTTSASASVICVMGHKDDEPARTAALAMAAKFERTVAVSVGLHIDNPTAEDFTVIQDNYSKILKLLCEQDF